MGGRSETRSPPCTLNSPTISCSNSTVVPSAAQDSHNIVVRAGVSCGEVLQEKIFSGEDRQQISKPRSALRVVSCSNRSPNRKFRFKRKSPCTSKRMIRRGQDSVSNRKCRSRSCRPGSAWATVAGRRVIYGSTDEMGSPVAGVFGKRECSETI